jgi:aminopeptidase N
MASIRSAVLADPVDVPTHPVIDTVPRELLSLLNRNSYEKGGFVLHMLRRQVGDSAFFNALRGYYASYRDGTALTDDLRREMERTSGEPLGWFFDQWLRRPGFPELNVTWSSDPSSQQVTLDIVQGSRFGAYRFPLTVELRGANGATERATVLVPAELRARIALPRGGHPFTPTALVVDPDVELLARIDVHPR